MASRKATGSGHVVLGCGGGGIAALQPLYCETAVLLAFACEDIGWPQLGVTVDDIIAIGIGLDVDGFVVAAPKTAESSNDGTGCNDDADVASKCSLLRLRRALFCNSKP